MKYDIVKLMARRKIRWKKRWVSGDSGGRLTFRSKKAGRLSDYRIYGNTVGGESVGDRTGNLFDETNGVVTDTYIKADGTTGIGVNGDRFICNRINVLPNNEYIFSWGKKVLGTDDNTPYIRVAQYDSNGNFLSRILLVADGLPHNRCVVTAGNAASLWDIRIDDASSTRGQHLEEVMLNLGSTAPPYEPYGYKVPVTVEGKNLLQNTATSQTINGVTFTVNSDGSVTCNTDENGATASTRFYLVGNGGSDFKQLNINTNAIITGCPLGGNINTYSLFILRKNDDMEPSYYNTWADTGNGINLPYNETNRYVIFINISTGTICNNLTFYPMIRKADIEDDTYEPYHAPVTTSIYLPEQISKVGVEAEYIDYSEQKMHRIGADDLDVTLPALPTLTGTNVLSVGTAVQPSNIEIKGKIKGL